MGESAPPPSKKNVMTFLESAILKFSGQYGTILMPKVDIGFSISEDLGNNQYHDSHRQSVLGRSWYSVKVGSP